MFQHTSRKFSVEINNAGHSGGILRSADLNALGQLPEFQGRYWLAVNKRVEYWQPKGVGIFDIFEESELLTPYNAQSVSHMSESGGSGVKLTDGEATFGGMRVEIERRKTIDIATRLNK